MNTRITRLSVFAAVAAVLLTLLALLNGGPSPADAAPRLQRPTSGPQVKVGTYNIKFNVSLSRTANAVERFTPYFDVAGFQEFESRKRDGAFKRLKGHDYFRSSMGGDPIVWDTSKLNFVKGRGISFSDPGCKPTKGGVRDCLTQFSATLVRLETVKGDHRMVVINLHAPSKVDSAGRPRPGSAARIVKYHRYLEKVRKVAASESKWGSVFVLGDFNVDQRRDVQRRYGKFPVSEFYPLGMKSVWHKDLPGRGTHGRRVIDNIFSKVAPLDSKVLSGFGASDHRPAYGVYRLP